MWSRFSNNTWKHNIIKFDTNGFVPVVILNGLFGLPSLFIRYFISITQKIWSIVYFNKKWTHPSETPACTIIEGSFVLNILHVTLTCPFISWCSCSATVKWTPRVWNYYLSYVKVNCIPASAEIISKFHNPNSSIFPNLYWNISSLSITSSAVISPYHNVL